ncbi:MAG: hypothetical protein KZQ83_11045 [gamma proteobacterium symbiont of Taylorina sp.]|nr:hypothetical protein [gamma proteobacterium symbiont of Taylorina sp.]
MKIMNNQYRIILVSLLVLVVSCANNEIQGVNENVCKDPRPQLCTMDYTPVCALLQNDQYKTYSNACSACSDSSVISYTNIACE